MDLRNATKLAGTAANVLGAALCFGGLLAACAPADEDGLPVETAEPETAAQWTDPEPETPEPGTSTCALPRPSVRCDAPLTAGQERVCRLGSRSYTVRAGKTYDPCKPAAVVVDIPTRTASAATHLGHESYCLGNVCWTGIGSGWAAESDTRDGGFIVVVPHGPTKSGDAEVNFHRDLVSELKRVADVDPERVYISGLAYGGDAAMEASCKQGRVFRGVSPNSAAVGCDGPGPVTPVPVIGFGPRGDRTFQAPVEAYARLNGCTRGPVAWRTFGASTRDAVCRSDKADPRASLVPCTQVTSAKLEPTSCKVWTGCRNGVEVVWCDVAPDTEHGRANAAADALVVYQNNTNLNTPSVAWRFFRQFAR